MVHIQQFPPAAWTIRLVLGMVGFAITGRVLYSEVKKRRLPTVQFYSQHLRITSAVCIWFAPITPLSLMLTLIPGFCMIRFICNMVPFYTQFVFLGFYQLSRLHYCFSNKQLHGNKGYPQWVFVVMVTIGIILWTYAFILHILVDILPSKCGYTDDFSLFYRYRARSILFDDCSISECEIYYFWIKGKPFLKRTHLLKSARIFKVNLKYQIPVR